MRCYNRICRIDLGVLSHSALKPYKPVHIFHLDCSFVKFGWHCHTMKDYLKEYKSEKLQEEEKEIEGEIKKIERDDGENIGGIAGGQSVSKWAAKDHDGERELKLEEGELHQNLQEQDEKKLKKKWFR